MKRKGIPRQFACFDCRKSFKRPKFSGADSKFMTAEQQRRQKKEVEDFEARRKYKCPDCGRVAHFVGTDFKAPKRTDLKAWEKVHAFIASGKIYYRGFW